MNPMDTDLLVEVLRHAPDAVAVVDGTQPGGGRILYSNSTLALLLQRPDEWPVGRKLGEIETTGSLGAAKVSSAPVSPRTRIVSTAATRSHGIPCQAPAARR